MSTFNEMEKWIKLVEDSFEVSGERIEEDTWPTKSANDKMGKTEQELEKANSTLMQAKVDKLNLLIKQKYYKQDQDIEDESVFQFHFEDKGDYHEFSMPLYILFGRKSREFTAQYWNNFFDGADIKVSFEKNIEEALKSAGRFNLTMKIDKKMKHEIMPDKDDTKERD